ASINAGNSGGPLLDRWGHVVGVNTLKITASGYEGLNFSISSGDVLNLLERRFNYRPERGKPSTLLANNSGRTSPRIMFTSDPSGAELHIDGAYAGNTPSAIELSAGDHTITMAHQKY